MAFAVAPPAAQVRGRRIARAAVAAALIAGMGVVGVATGPAALATPNPSCLSFDSSTQSTTTGVMYCDVPAGVTGLSVIATGAGGGGGSGVRTSTGGHGAVVTTTITVTPGETLDLQVGTGGAGNSSTSYGYGGGGGGWSAVLRSSTNLVTAGGGGGGGAASSGTALSSGLVLAGGNGGTPVATAGSPTVVSAMPGDLINSGGAGTASAGGAGGTGAVPGAAGSAGTGGGGSNACSMSGAGGGNGWQGGSLGSNCGANGAGGGAGAFGGGGGASVYGAPIAGGSAGGGSSSVAAGSAIYAVASNGGAYRAAGGDGRIQLAAAAPTVSGISPSGGSASGGTSVTVTGTHFGSGTTVTVGGQACTSVVVASSTSLTCTTAAHAAGVVNVVVTSSSLSATLTGGYTYAVAVPGAPTAVTATAGTSSVAVTWAAPTTGGSVIRYEVRTAQGQAVCVTTTLSCVLGAEAGQVYDVIVVAVGSAGQGAPGTATSAAVSSPVVATSVPTSAPLTLTTDKGQITKASPGQEIVVIGTGFAPYSTATIVVYSSPTVLGTVVTDGSGNFSKAVTVPASLAAGAHNLVASGVDPQGAAHAMRMEVTVAAGGSTGASLASTGFSAGVPLGLGGLLLAGGAGLAWAGRRTRADV